MLYLFIVLIIIVAVLLTLVVLAQSSKGGVGSSFGGSGASQMIGVKKTGDLLEKLTWGFITAIIVLSLTVNVIMKPSSKTQTPSEVPAASTPESGAGADGQ